MEDTKKFISEGFDESAKSLTNPDFDSFYAGAMFIINHLIKRKRI